MPSSITIRDIPDEVFEKLKVQAESNHRSINSEVIVQLKRLVQSTPVNPNQIIEQAKKLKSQIQGMLSMEEIQQAIDEGRP